MKLQITLKFVASLLILGVAALTLSPIAEVSAGDCADAYENCVNAINNIDCGWPPSWSCIVSVGRMLANCWEIYLECIR
ncbi:MAG: hypothetical protein OXH00_02250 [Candidatus Poribacteria bacterium]|nr:hypothetical protein [Candidatus Poribacteria bacterium]